MKHKTLISQNISAPLTALLDLILPPVCLNCHTPLTKQHQLCAKCWQEIDFISAPFCEVTGHPLPIASPENTLSAQAITNPPLYDKARAVAHYQGTMRNLVHKLKYQDSHDLVPLFASWLHHHGKDLLHTTDPIIPIPLHTTRLWQRKFNQAALLAKRLAQITNKNAAFNLLLRPKKTCSQVGLSASERKSNLKGAFAINSEHPHLLRDQNILLIDDVLTTGATAGAATQILKQHQVKEVNLLCLAIVYD